MRKTILNIEGIKCSGCVEKVETALKELEGVHKAYVSLEEGTAEVHHDEEKAKEAHFKKAIAEAGYVLKKIQAS